MIMIEMLGETFGPLMTPSCPSWGGPCLFLLGVSPVVLQKPPWPDSSSSVAHFLGGRWLRHLLVGVKKGAWLPLWDMFCCVFSCNYSLRISLIGHFFFFGGGAFVNFLFLSLKICIVWTMLFSAICFLFGMMTLFRPVMARASPSMGLSLQKSCNLSTKRRKQNKWFAVNNPSPTVSCFFMFLLLHFCQPWFWTPTLHYTKASKAKDNRGLAN